MKKVIEFRIDCDRLADEEYSAYLQNKLRGVLEQLRGKLSQSQITEAQIANEKERKRIEALPKLDFKIEYNKKDNVQTDVPYIGDKKIPESYLLRMKLMPDMTRSEAHTYLIGITGPEWNTLLALREFDGEFLFIDNEDGTFCGSHYESDEEIRSRLEKEAN